MIKERLRYQKNTLSYLMCLIALLLNIVVLGVLLGYPPQLQPDMLTGLDILCHIVFLMLTFLVAEKEKVYSKMWSYLGCGLAAFSFLRIFIFLLPYKGQGLMEGWAFVLSLILLIAITGLHVAGAVMCLLKAKVLASLPKLEEGH